MTQPGRDRLFSPLRRLAIAAVLGVACCAPVAFAQTTLKGGVSHIEYTDEYARTCEEQNQNNPYAGMDPFACHGQMAPTDSRGQCSLNIGTVWKKVGNTCYYCAPINSPIQGFVLPLDKVASAQSQGWRCGANQTDLCTAICYGGRTYSTPPGVTVVGGGPGLPPTPKSRARQGGTQGGPPPGYVPQPGPPPVPGAANPCLSGGYNYCNNGPGARVPTGCVCNTVTVTDGGPTEDKALNRPSSRAKPKVNRSHEIPPVDLAAIDRTMADCLKLKVPYSLPPTVSPHFRQKAIAEGPPSARSAPFGLLPNESQIFLEAAGMALQAQSVHDAKFGDVLIARSVTGHSYEQSDTDRLDYMVGWLVHCLGERGALKTEPNLSASPFNEYATFLGVPTTDPRLDPSPHAVGTLTGLPRLTFWNGFSFAPFSEPLPLMPR